MQKILVFLMTVSLAPLCFAENTSTPREDLYNFANKGDIQALKKLKADGYSFEMSDKNGNSALCESIYKNDHSSYALLKSFGANVFHPCMNKIPSKTKKKFDKEHEKWLLSINSGKIDWIGSTIQDEMAKESANMISVKTAPISSVVFKNSKQGIHPYISVKASYSKTNMNSEISDTLDSYEGGKTDWIWGGSVALGIQTKFLRTELEYNQSAKANDIRHTTDGLYDIVQTSQSHRSYMLNGYIDIPTNTSLRPYIGAGIGLAQVKNQIDFLNTNTFTKRSENNFAYQLMAGLAWDFNYHWALDIGYRYVDNGDTSWNIADGAAKINFDSTEHQITAGIKYTF